MQEVKLNSRVKFLENGQRQFLEEARSSLGTNISGLAQTAHVCDRTVRDWKREKNNMDFTSLFLICSKIDTKFPGDIKVLPPYWSTKKASKLGGRRHIELYGSPGTPEGRRRGGINSQRKFRSDPTYARKRGLFLRKKINYPGKSAFLAEFVGIMLGDGCMSQKCQFHISFNGEKDKSHAVYIYSMIKKLFGIESSYRLDKECGRADIVVSSTNLVEFLQKIGLKMGNKVKNQVDVPEWIFEAIKYQAACLRGLFDTDGCVYQHTYTVDGKVYRYVKMGFRNYSFPLLRSIERMLKNLGFKAKINIKQKAVFLNSPSEVKRYFSLINTHNPRYFGRYLEFFAEKTGRQEESHRLADCGGLLTR